ncbi:MAG: hypothetical protein QM647_07210 [Asticcacaulis sp.]|uniref:hypothetical protein n=1 Tax=Asticcacaulis sp. TaxID=1872648 RepID=UPI0039E4AB20
MHRRALLASVVAFLTLPAQAVPATESKTIPAEKFFPFLSNYYNLPPTERSQFRLSYRLIIQGAQPDQISLKLTDGTQIVPDGRNTLSPLPTSAQLKNRAQLTFTRPTGAKFGVSLDVIPSQLPAPTLDAHNLALAVNQASAGAKKAAGLLAMAVPTLDRVGIYGVSSGQVRLANGDIRTLPLTPAAKEKNGAYSPAYIAFVPSEWPTAVTLTFPDMPSRLLIMDRN